jgi:hypothetical protein
MQLQNILYAGDTLDFTTTVNDYPASTWTLKYRLTPTTGTAIDLTGSASGTNHRVVVTASSSAAWVAGAYSWTAYVENGTGERYTLARGRLEIKPASATLAAGVDTRSQAEIALAAIDAVLANRATVDQMEYSIAGRSLKRMTVAELLALRSHFEGEVSKERGITRRILVGYR